MRTCLMILLTSCTAAFAGDSVKDTEWLVFGRDLANTKYAPLAQIDRGNFERLELAWSWESASQDVVRAGFKLPLGQFKPTPLVVDGLMYVATELSQVAAIDVGSGNTAWVYDPESYNAGRPANVGFQHRGVAYWSDGMDARILIATHDRKLVALDAKSGKPCPDFGENGSVDLVPSLGRPVNTRQITHTSPPAVIGDTVVVGSIVHDGPTMKEAPPGHVRAFDVKTGALKWVFKTIPSEGQFGNETWEDDSWTYTGAANVWSMFAVDPELGYVYMPTSTPTNDMYGGHRLGDNLFAESLVCVDGETGERIWHFQAVHHGLWDYDFPTAPNLVDIVVDGKPVKAVAQVSKQGFCYVFDRVTGEPVWPIEERPVPQSNVEGERTSPTQPFPTKPAPFERQGITEDDLIDFTPELHAAAVEIVKPFTLGPIFTPPVTEEESNGVIQVPGTGGGANWPGAAVDPETGIIYIPSATHPSVFPLMRPDPNRSNLRYTLKTWFNGVPGPEGLPLLKPPYARVTAIDLNTGEHVWMTPNGDGPRNHPVLKDLNLPPLGTDSGGPLVTKTLLFVTQKQGYGPENSPRINVFDKANGRLLGHIPLPDNPFGNPITYMHQGKQYLVVAVGGGPFFSGLQEKDAEEAIDDTTRGAIVALSKATGTTPQLLAYALSD